MANHEEACKNGYAEGIKVEENLVLMAYKYLLIKHIFDEFRKTCPLVNLSDAALGALLAIGAVAHQGEEI